MESFKLIKNLEDAGCSDKEIEEYIQNPRKQTMILKNQRCCLLEKLHVIQNQLTCLDYLLHFNERENQRWKRKEF